MDPSSLTDNDLAHLSRCVELATEALEAGDQPFGSVLADDQGTSLREARNEEGGGDATRHPELELAQWAAHNLSPEERREATVFTTGEHCPMCAAAHAWVGLGRIVYATSAEQTSRWYAELGAAPSPARPLPVNEVAPEVPVVGPVDQFVDAVRELHRRRFAREGATGA